MTASVPMLAQATVCSRYSTCMTVRSPDVLTSKWEKSVSAITLPSIGYCTPRSFATALAAQRLAQGLFLDAAGALAALQFGDHVGRLQAVVGQRDHAVKPEIGHFAHKFLASLRRVGAIDVLGGHDRFGR